MSVFRFGKARDKEYGKELETLGNEAEEYRKELEDCKDEEVKIYRRIGVEVYKLFKAGKIEVPQINNYMTKMEELNTNIAKLEKGIREREVRTKFSDDPDLSKVINDMLDNNEIIICTCGAMLDKDDKFCDSCGKKVEDLIAELSKLEQTPVKDTIICSCGAEVSRNSKFCNSCGKKVEDLIAEPSKVEQAPVKECICGAKIQPGQFMCLECGRKIE